MNPLRAIPHPLLTLTVTRLGLPGLIACALCVALLRGLKRLPRWLIRLALTLVAFGVLMGMCPPFEAFGGPL